MNDIQRKISEIEKQDRRSRIAYLIAGSMVILSIVILLIYSDFKRKTTLDLTQKNSQLEQKNSQILEYQEMVEELNAKNLNTIDSLNSIATSKYDSIQKELNKYKNNIEKTAALKSIYSAEQNSKKITTEIQNARVQQYYKKPVLTNDTEISITTQKIDQSVYIRMYSYNPDPKIKKSLIEIFQQQKYRVKVYPDWSKKPSFFSNNSTILYYSSKTKQSAERLQMILNRSGFKFNISKGSGLGISEKERQNTLIIHYMK